MLQFSNFLQYKKILIWILVGIIILGGGIFAYFYFTAEKSLKIISPNGEEELRAGKTYQITWKSRKIGKVGILLIKGEDSKESKWIAKDISAGAKKYDWQIFVWEKPGQDYKIAIMEYPWEEGQKIDYSDETFTILGPRFASCDELSIGTEWTFVPSDFPNLRKVFITEKSFQGNLEGLEGADKKCQEEAEKQGFTGTWKAFLGDDTILAAERLNLEGIFVTAESSSVLPQVNIPSYTWKSFEEFLKKSSIARKEKEAFISAHQSLEKPFQKFLENWYAKEDEKACHRLLGKNFDTFLEKLSDSLTLNQEKMEETFLSNLANVWLGRINKESKRDCTTIFSKYPSADISRNYSFTTTCQNWKSSEEIIPGYLAKTGAKIEFPKCYTPQGKRIDAVGVAGLSSGITEKEKGVQFFTPSLGKSCNQNQKLLCIEQ